ncbi:hypothetical protein Igni_0824 [Ignicoccus hospitalis KIN4/I]|uniref:DUF447 domain-containing protein n=1 Tax=Ignicoccus hospitalis (strain KIN4/I / DSM 18386 / JCM 14125) TaxID=453591 RepID=A8AAQ4_IGNH4|nr:hypothetical protein Igni_0824 [Ignicoccus hospitalis KIN4/I]
MKYFSNTYNESLAVSGGARSVLGVWREGDGLAFNVYPGRFERSMLREGKLSLFASCSSAEYADFAVFKERPLASTPLGPGPSRWYLAVECELLSYRYSFPAKAFCKPTKGFWRPAGPPRRAFFYILEALVLITRLHLKDERERIRELLSEALRLGDEEDREVARRLLEHAEKVGSEGGS